MEPLLYRLQRHHKKIGHDAQRVLRNQSHQAGHGEGGMIKGGELIKKIQSFIPG